MRSSRPTSGRRASSATPPITSIHAHSRSGRNARAPKVRSVAYFGGVFHWLRYDNLGAAVQRVLGGNRREETTRFVAFRLKRFGQRRTASGLTPSAAATAGTIFRA